MTGLEPVLGMLRLAVHTKVGSTVSKEVVIRYSQPHSYRLSPHLRLPISAHNYLIPQRTFTKILEFFLISK